MGKSLIVYFSLTNRTRQICESARQPGKVDVVELRERFDRSVLSGMTIGQWQAFAGRASRVDPMKMDFSSYDTILLATPVWAGAPVPAMNAFLHQTDLQGREVQALLISGGMGAKRCAVLMRRRINLANGVCRDVITIPAKAIYRKKEDVVSYLLARA